MPFTKKPRFSKKKTGGSTTRRPRTYSVRSGRTYRQNDSMSGMYKKLERQTKEYVGYLTCDANSSVGRGQFTLPLVSDGEGRYYTGVAITLTLQGAMTGDVTVDTVCFSTTYACAKPSSTASEEITLVRHIVITRKHKADVTTAVEARRASLRGSRPTLE